MYLFALRELVRQRTLIYYHNGRFCHAEYKRTCQHNAHFSISALTWVSQVFHEEAAHNGGLACSFTQVESLSCRELLVNSGPVNQLVMGALFHNLPFGDYANCVG